MYEKNVLTVAEEMEEDERTPFGNRMPTALTGVQQLCRHLYMDYVQRSVITLKPLTP